MTTLASRPSRLARSVWDVGRRAVDDFKDDRGSLAAAALAFYGLVSLGPLVIVVTHLAGVVLGEQAARQALVDNLTVTLGSSSARAVERIAAELGETGYPQVGVIGLFAALYAASRVFGSVQDALNQIWNVQTLPRHELRDRAGRLLWVRLRSALLVVSLGILLLALALGTTVFNAALAHLPALFKHPFEWRVIELLGSFAVSSVVFAVLYRVVPDARIAWSHVWPGAWLAGALFALGKFGMTWYVGTHGLGTPSDTAAALVIVLLWASFSSNVFLLGAEVAEACAARDGAPVEPLPHAKVVVRRRAR